MNRVSWAGRVAGTIVAAWLAVAGGAKACDVLPPSLTATRVGNDVALAWTGALGIGESWVVYRGEIDVMWTFGRNEILIASVGAAMYTDAGAATDGADHYWLVRCEGPGGAGSFSNMAFKLARHLDTVPGFLNVYFVSVPGWLGLPDVADTSDPSPCTPAAGVGDGVMNADDLLCAWWTSGRGSLTLSRRDEETCAKKVSF